MNSDSDIEKAAAALLAGELVAFPTETVYGLGADATNDRAVARIYAAKRRPSFNPLIAHVADAAAAFHLGVFPEAARRLALSFWPGPLSLVVRRGDDCHVSLLASAGLSSLALRVPRHPAALDLLRAVERPVVAPSANPSGRVSPTTADHVRRFLGNDVAVILDGGPCPVGVESTVVSFLEDHPVILRPGGVSREAIEEVVGPLASETRGGRPHAPGQLASHYAPRAALRLDAAEPHNGETYLGFGAHDGGAYNLSRGGDLVEAAANLFRFLHDIDAAGAARIAVAPIPRSGLGEAINDRLTRAAAPRQPA